VYCVTVYVASDNVKINENIAGFKGAYLEGKGGEEGRGGWAREGEKGGGPTSKERGELRGESGGQGHYYYYYYYAAFSAPCVGHIRMTNRRLAPKPKKQTSPTPLCRATAVGTAAGRDAAGRAGSAARAAVGPRPPSATPTPTPPSSSYLGDTQRVTRR